MAASAGVARQTREREKREQIIALKETRLQQMARRLKRAQQKVPPTHGALHIRAPNPSVPDNVSRQVEEMNAKHTTLEAIIGMKARQVRPLQVQNLELIRKLHEAEMRQTKVRRAPRPSVRAPQERRWTWRGCRGA